MSRSTGSQLRGFVANSGRITLRGASDGPTSGLHRSDTVSSKRAAAKMFVQSIDRCGYGPQNAQRHVREPIGVGGARMAPVCRIGEPEGHGRNGNLAAQSIRNGLFVIKNGTLV
jgi:hypothetical protein